MRAEDYDWTIYHVITGAKRCSVEDICEKSNISREIVQESLDRLVSHLLITCRGDLYQACSMEEFMITNQMKHDPFSNIIIENGVVKVRDPGTITPPGDGDRSGGV